MWVGISASSPTTAVCCGGDEIWQRLLNDQYAMERRMMLQAMVDRRSAEERAEGPTPLQQPDVEDDDEHHWALNDFYLRAYRDEISPTCTLELEIDGEVVDQIRGDGLILSTPHRFNGLCPCGWGANFASGHRRHCGGTDLSDESLQPHGGGPAAGPSGDLALRGR